VPDAIYKPPFVKFSGKIMSVCFVLKPVCVQIISYFGYLAQIVFFYCYKDQVKLSRFQRKCVTAQKVFQSKILSEII